MHWLRKLGFSVEGKRIFDCQVAEYLLSRQTIKYPSLEDTAQKYLGRGKIDIIDKEYWSKGINTHEIPREVLGPYATLDTELTFKVYEKQKTLIPPHQERLFSICMQDLLVLQEIEWNGLYFNEEKSLERAEEIDKEIREIQEKLNLFHSVPNFNWNSTTHLSALLYGGKITIEVRIPAGFWKTGKKAGQVRYSKEAKEYHLPRRYTPFKNSKLEKDGVWSVDEKFLQKLKGDRSLVEGILKIKELEHRNSTYLLGFPKRMRDMHWPKNIVHGQYNQCVTRTGRLSSDKPNLQNPDGEILDLIETRYG